MQINSITRDQYVPAGWLKSKGHPHQVLESRWRFALLVAMSVGTTALKINWWYLLS